MLRTITVCQNIVCQNKGSKSILHRLQTEYAERFTSTYPNLIIQAGDCMGGCEQGPIVRVNDSVLLREADNATVMRLLENPEEVLGQVMHVLEKDRETFERIISGGLY